MKTNPIRHWAARGLMTHFTAQKGIFLLIFIFMCSGCVQAQGWRVAPVVGLNVSSVSFSQANRDAFNSSTVSTTFGSLVRWQAGAWLEYAYSDRFSVRSGLVYTGKGSSVRFMVTRNGSVAPINGTIPINYLEVPLLVNVAINDKGLRFVGGPVLALALSGKFISTEASLYGVSINSNLSVGSEPTDGLLPTELSLSLGLVKQRDLGGRPFEFGLHIQPSLTNWDPGAKRNPAYTARNTVVGLRAAYFFDLRR